MTTHKFNIILDMDGFHVEEECTHGTTVTRRRIGDPHTTINALLDTIEYLAESTYEGYAQFVRLKGLEPWPLAIPTQKLNPQFPILIISRTALFSDDQP